MTPWKQSGSCPVRGHCLLRFVLSCETMPKSNPTGRKIFIEIVCLLEIFTSLWELFDQKVVAAHRIPADGAIRIGIYKVMRYVI